MKHSEVEAFTQIIESVDKLKLLKVLLSYPMINWVSQFFSRTRNAETLLRFVDYCRAILRQSADKVSVDELANFERILVGYELHAYDRLNDFESYVTLFERSKYPYNYRYDIILRKKAKQDAGKLPRTMLRHQQSELSDEELDARYREMERLFEYIKRRM